MCRLLSPIICTAHEACNLAIPCANKAHALLAIQAFSTFIEVRKSIRKKLREIKSKKKQILQMGNALFSAKLSDFLKEKLTLEFDTFYDEFSDEFNEEN